MFFLTLQVIGNGSFGVVYQARLIDSQEMVAIKKVLQDKRFKVCCLSCFVKSNICQIIIVLTVFFIFSFFFKESGATDHEEA